MLAACLGRENGRKALSGKARPVPPVPLPLYQQGIIPGIRMRRLILPLLLIATAAYAQPKQGTSTLQLDSGHATVTVTAGGAQGRFETVAGALQFDPAKPDASTLALSFDAGSITDAAVRKALDAERFPELRIASTAAAKSGTMPMTVTVRDVTRSVIFQVSFKSVSRNVVTVHAQAALKSGDFHLGGDIPIVIDAAFDKVEPTTPLP
jgi:polyisoprenoid-binding protein YceI